MKHENSSRKTDFITRQAEPQKGLARVKGNQWKCSIVGQIKGECRIRKQEKARPQSRGRQRVPPAAAPGSTSLLPTSAKITTTVEMGRDAGALRLGPYPCTQSTGNPETTTPRGREKR